MIYFDATKWDDRESVHVPPEWGMVPIRMLYQKDFYPGVANDNYEILDRVPDANIIRSLAESTVDDPLVCINIGEHWRMWIPGNWSYENTPGIQGLTGLANNEAQLAQIQWTLTEFRKYNSTSKLTWWGLPHNSRMQVTNYVPVAQDNRYLWKKGPMIENTPHCGLVQFETWIGRELRGLMDYTAPDCYYRGTDKDEPDMTYKQCYMEQIQYYKTVSDAGYRVPMIAFLMSRYIEEPYNPMPDDLFNEINTRCKQILQSEDGIAFWEGEGSNQNAQLAAFDSTDHWIGLWSRWFTGG